MATDAVELNEFRVDARLGESGRQLLLLMQRKKDVRFDADHERTFERELRKSGPDRAAMLGKVEKIRCA